MAEGIILHFAKSIVGKIASSVTEEIKSVKPVKSDLKIISQKLKAICAILADAEEKQYANVTIKIWLQDLKNVVYDIDDLFDEVATDALHRRVHEGRLGRKLMYYLSSSNPLISRFELSHKVKILRVRLDKIVAKKYEFNLTERPVKISRDELAEYPYVHEPTIIGREAAKDDILRRVATLSNTSNELPVLPIVGIGGLGKTALAKLVYKDVDVLDFDLKLWACVSVTFQLRKIVEDIIKDGTGDKNLSSQDSSTLIKMLYDLLGGKKYFLVLDDVWEDDIAKWLDLKNLLMCGEIGSVILITTRNIYVASITGTIEPYILDNLPFEACWSIFKQLAFREGEEDRYQHLVRIGRLIVEKCNGIPLAVQTLGNMLRSERDEQQWEKIKNMDSFIGQSEGLMASLKLSYDQLPSELKPCFSYLSLFLKHVDLKSFDIISMWSALGLLQLNHSETDIESIGYSRFLELVSRSFLHEPNLVPNNLYMSECKMHDLMHDLATHILGEELLIVTKEKIEVSEYTRHIIWGFEGSKNLKEKPFPIELSNAPSIRSFRFGHSVNALSQSLLEGIISNFIDLRILDLSHCQFEVLPKLIGNLKHLRFLNLSNNSAIKFLPNSISKLLNLETLDLIGCEQLEKLPNDINLLQNLRNFKVTTCQLSLGTNFNELSSLRFLAIAFCKGLISLWDDCIVGCLNSLRFLSIGGCPKLTCLPNSMQFLISLETLSIFDCEMLDLDKGKSSLHYPPKLRQLIVKGVRKMEMLPDGFRYAAGFLQDLHIRDCTSLVELPNWLQYFTSLHHLLILDCPNLRLLPEGFAHLKSVQELVIRGCPHLSERCSVPNGEDYFLIRRIPKFILDDVAYTNAQNQTEYGESSKGIFTEDDNSVQACEEKAIPAPDDEVWDLHEITKDSQVQERLKAANISSVKEFLHLYHSDANSLIKILGVSPLVFEEIIEHATSVFSNIGLDRDYRGKETSINQLLKDYQQNIPVDKDPAYEKKPILALNDEVWDLLVAKDLKVQERLKAANVSSVKEFLQLYHSDANSLKKMLRVSPPVFEEITKDATSVVSHTGRERPVPSNFSEAGERKPQGPDIGGTKASITFDKPPNQLLKDFQHKIPADNDSVPEKKITLQERHKMLMLLRLLDDNHEFEREKLIQLWMADGFLKMEPLEDHGDRIFRTFLEENYIFPHEVGISKQTSLFKVNSEQISTLCPRVKTIDDLSSRDENFKAIKLDDYLHISLQPCNNNRVDFESLEKFDNNRIRTLLLFNNFLERLPPNFFSTFELLTALDLSGSCLIELPDSIRNARELRYIDLSWTQINRLPESMVCLLELRTLRVNGCMNLTKLPERMMDLINLRHLVCDILGQLNSMPRGIGNLTELRTLSAFIVDKKIIDEDGNCNLKELKHMNNLSGSLCISGLENASSMDAKDVSLINKKCLKCLELRWSDTIEYPEKGELYQVLEHLMPNILLEELKIVCFPGESLPNWIGDPRYQNMVSMTLFKCENCLNYPVLGQLPKLRNLEVVEMNSVTKIDHLLYINGENLVAFPVLEQLSLDGMERLEMIENGEFPCLAKLIINRCPILTTLSSFPKSRSLKELKIIKCPRLQYLPVEMLSNLINLVIDACPSLRETYSNEGQRSHEIEHVTHVWIESEDESSNGIFSEDDNSVEDSWSFTSGV